MRINACIVALAIIVSCGSLRAADASWTVDVTPSEKNTIKGSTTAYPDVLICKDGKLTSQTSGKQGFAPGVCTIKTEGGKTTVSADLVSPKHGKNHYELEVHGTAVTGTMVWSKMGEDGKAKEAEFTIKSKK